MQVEQKNLWDNVTRSLSDDATARGIAAYQANVAEYHKSTVVQQEHFEKTVGVSANGMIDMATYEKPGANRTVAQEVDQHKDMKADDRKNEIAVLAIQLQQQITKQWRKMVSPSMKQTVTRL